MENKVLTAAQIAEVQSGNGKKKCELPVWKMFSLAIFAGAFIGYGATSHLTMTANMKGELAILGKLLGAICFSQGLMLVIFFGAELFTGNCLIPIAVLDKKATIKGMFTNWVAVYAGNIIGSLIMAYLVYSTGLFGSDVMRENAIAVANAKGSMGFLPAVVRGTLCNILVVFAIWFQSAAPDMGGKILAIIFPIMSFTLAGFEHSVANMFFIPLAQLLGGEITFVQCWIGNILPVTIGNIIGGVFVVAIPMYYIYLHKKN